MDTNSNVPEDARVSIGIAVALWGATVVGAAASGLFEKLDFEEIAALATFSVVFALMTYLLDRSVRDYVDSLLHRGTPKVTSPAAKSPGARPAAT
jgi:hypothetical protein